MALNNFKCYYLLPLHFKGLIRDRSVTIPAPVTGIQSGRQVNKGSSKHDDRRWLNPTHQDLTWLQCKVQITAWCIAVACIAVSHSVNVLTCQVYTVPPAERLSRCVYTDVLRWLIVTAVDRCQTLYRSVRRRRNGTIVRSTDWDALLCIHCKNRLQI